EHGSDGLVVCGTTGESPTLSDAEKLELFAAAVDAVGDRATVVAGTGTNDTAHSAKLTAKAHELGVDAFLVVTPYYNKPPQRAIVRHFQEIAARTDKPIVVYNIPSRVVTNIEPETIAELAEIENVHAVKQADEGDGAPVQRRRRRRRPRVERRHGAGLRPPEGADQSDRDQGCAQPARARGRRLPPADGRSDRPGA